MDRRKILFVDDEPNILAGLRRMLRSMHKSYDLHFAESGMEALQIMEGTTFDVVVSDMRMPGMDGADFLTEVRKRYPHSIRIMLTGQCDDKSILRTIGVVHQFLAKPCDPEKLKEILMRSSALHRLLTDGNLKDIISCVDSLPSLPNIYTQLMEQIRRPETSLDDIGDTISQDVAMTAKILQLVNSAFFGLYQKVESPARAVKLIGIDTIKALVLVSQIFSSMQIPKGLFAIETLWAHSLMVGKMAKLIADGVCEDKNLADNCYIAGILHDIGKLILVAKLEQQYREAVDLAQKEMVSLREAERKAFKATHCDVGAYLVGLWGFHGDVVEAIGFHHQLEDYPSEVFSPALAVHVANVMYYQHYKEHVVGESPSLNVNYIDKIGLGEHLQKWQELCLAHLKKHNINQL